MKFPRNTTSDSNGCIFQERHSGYGRKTGVFETTRRAKTKFEGETWISARVSFFLNIGDIPRSPPSLKDGLVLHVCDNKSCINPDHLYLGTQTQNMNDKYDRNKNIRAILSAARKGIKYTDETRQKMSVARTGMKFSEQHCANIRLAKTGVKHTPETREKMSRTRRAKLEVRF